MFIMASVGSINDKKLSKISRHCHIKKSKCTHFSKKLQFLVYTSSGVYSLKYFLGQKRKFVPKEPKRKAQSLKTAFLGFSTKKLPNPTKNQKVGVGQKYTNAAPTKVTQLHWDSTYSPQIISQDMYSSTTLWRLTQTL